MKFAEFKAQKGVIKVELELTDDKISHISLSGDFFMYPEDAIDKLEQSLNSVKADKDSLFSAVQRFYSSTNVQTPMLEPEHWVEAILRAVGG